MGGVNAKYVSKWGKEEKIAFGETFYMNLCVQSVLANQKGGPNIYVGESARSLHERSGEHWKDAEGGKEESHMVQHVGETHKGEAPDFNFKVVKSFRTSLDRQVPEAIMILMRGGELF